jgi:hypothetical protein
MYEAINHDNFFKLIWDGGLDLIHDLQGEKCPYKCVFKFRNGDIFGYEYEEKYFIKKQEA